MKIFLTILLLCASIPVIAGCSVFGNSGVEIAPYKVLKKEGAFELRHYERMVLVTATMSEGIDNQRGSFYKLFDYISGENSQGREIPMTAPVFMDQENKKTEKMSFVLPYNYTMDMAPSPQDETVKLEEVKNYTVAVVTFSGLLKQDNITEHQIMLEEWIKSNGYKKTGSVKAAGYNPPFTIPAMRRNEVLISVIKP